MTRRIVLVDIGSGLVLRGVLPSVALFSAYSAKLSARGGVVPYVYSISAGALPDGLFIDSGTGIISGVSTAPGLFSFTVRVTDLSGAFLDRQFSITVIAEPLTLSGAATAWTVGTPYSYAYTAANGVPPYTWSITAGSLPAGITLDTDTGVISGTPTSAGAPSWTIRVVDSALATLDQQDNITLQLLGDFTDAPVGSAYSSDVAINGGNGIYSNPRLTSGSIPAGLSLSIVGGSLRLSGTPTVAATSVFTAAVDSGDGQTATSPQSVVVSAGEWYDALFTSGEIGMVIDFNDLSTLFKDTSHTIPCTAAGDAIGSARCKRTGAYGVVTHGTATLRFDAAKSKYYAEGNGAFNMQWHSTVPSVFGANIACSMITACSYGLSSQSLGAYIGPAYPASPSGFDGMSIAQLNDPTKKLEFIQFGAANSTGAAGGSVAVNGDKVAIAKKTGSGTSWHFDLYVSGTLFTAASACPGATITDLTLDIGRGLSAQHYYSAVFLNRAITLTEISAVTAAAL